MSSARSTAVVVCPGRGTYNKTELGYLARHFPDAALLAEFDAIRESAGQDTLTTLDNAERFSMVRHTRGDNASALIFAATLGDYQSITDAIDVVAVTGNSMGWYSALACAGATTPTDGFTIANTMGTLMQEALIGGQLVYPFLGDDWLPDAPHKAELLALVAEINARADHTLALSIDLGGMLVLAGDEAGLTAFESTVEPLDGGRFPMRLHNHAAFHTHLQTPVAERGQAQLGEELFRQPRVPMVDGRGAIWWPHASDVTALRDYTLGAQVTQTYDFTRAITVAAREFAPDMFIVTGPGTTLGGAVAQSLIMADWRGLTDKAAFKARQESDPLLLAMGMAEQRASVT